MFPRRVAEPGRWPSPLGAKGGKYGPDLDTQVREEGFHHVPDQLHIHAKIVVNHLVAGAGDLAPRNLRVFLPEFVREVLDCLTDNLNPPQNVVLDLLVFRRIPQIHARNI